MRTLASRKKARRRKPDENRGTFRYSRWRVVTLVGVHLLFGLHIAHWKITGKTLAPLELNEVMYTLELGIVTAGFLLMLTALLATAIFGRFFCSWGCHILALQDMSAWLLHKLRIKPVAIRSRLLMVAPLAAAAYMFVWPQVSRLIRGDTLPQLKTTTDAEGWASFVTEDFWRNLPGPGVAAMTFLTVGFVVVYILGSRSFCRYGCPYGAVFGIADRIAPGKIRLAGDCAQCGACTAACQSHIRVHEELQRFGTVVNPACLKDLDCVAVCPNNAVKYGFGLPTLLTARVNDAQVKTKYDLSLLEELLLGAVFLIVLFAYRGLYDLIPFLMSLALAGLAGYLSVVALRLLRNEHVSFNRWQVKRQGSLTGRGWAFVVAATVFFALTLHSGFVRYHGWRGLSITANAAPQTESDATIDDRIAHLERVVAWDLWPWDRAEKALVEAYQRRSQWTLAESLLRQRWNAGRNDIWTYEKWAENFAGQQRWPEAIKLGDDALRLFPESADAHYTIAGWCFQTERFAAAAAHLRRAVEIRPHFPDALFDLGALQVKSGDVPGGILNLRRTVELRADHAPAHYNLAVALAMTGRINEAKQHAKTAAELDPQDQQAIELMVVLQRESN